VEDMTKTFGVFFRFRVYITTRRLCVSVYLSCQLQ